MNNKQVVSEIQNAFQNTPYPHDNDIGRDEYEGQELWKPLQNRHWSEVPLELIKRYRDELSMFSYEGFRFYLPAFMLAILLHPDEVDTLHSNLLVNLTPLDYVSRQMNSSLKTTNSGLEGFRRRAKLFSQQEGTAIIAFLNFYKQEYSEEYPVRELKLVDGALDFWKQQSPEQ
ncbi:MAG: DUF6714 family protein [Chloroflexota bacterium]